MKKGITAKKLLVGLLIVALLGVGGGLFAWNRHTTQQNNIKKQAAATVQTAQVAKQNENVTYNGIDGKNALELLEAGHKVETKTYSFGEQVTSIDGVIGNGPKYWTLYVNGKMSEVGASAYQSKISDKIEWKLEQL